MMNEANRDTTHQRVAVNAVLSEGYYADFSYVNRRGVPKVSGIYNVVLDGHRRACFTTSSDIPLSECPFDSTLEEESSSSEKSSSSEFVPESSSSVDDDGPNSSDSLQFVRGTMRHTRSYVQIALDGHRLNVSTPLAGRKELKLFDLQGNLVYTNAFSDAQMSFDLSFIPSGIYVVRVMADNRLLESSKIRLQR